MARSLAIWLLFCLLPFLTGCGPRLSGVYVSDYSELLNTTFQQFDSTMEQFNSLMLPIMPPGQHQALEAQQRQAMEQSRIATQGLLARFQANAKVQLEFSWTKAIVSGSGMQGACSYRVKRDHVLLFSGRESVAMRLERRADGSLAWNGVLFRPTSVSMTALDPLWSAVAIGSLVLIAAWVYYAWRRDFFSATIALEYPWRLSRRGLRTIPPSSQDENVCPRQFPPLATEEDVRRSRRKTNKDLAYMPPELRQQVQNDHKVPD